MTRDEVLLQFGRRNLAHFNEKRVQELLDGPEGELFREHLRVALWVDGWAQRLADASFENEGDEHFVRALREVAAHLRQGDLAAGGPLRRNLGLGTPSREW